MSTISERALTPDDPTAPETAKDSPVRHSADQLEYLADIIAELRTMAQDGHLITLAGILALAHAEAMQQVILRQRLAKN